MNRNDLASTCDPIRAHEYLAEQLSVEDQWAFESHIDQCIECRRRLLDGAGSERDWQWVGGVLGDDPYDAQWQASGNIASDPPDELLRREIQGWLDPTDDPRMLGRFAGYEISGVIGHGGMGIVLKGMELSLNRYVAIKVLAPRLASSNTANKRFQREAEATAAVLHENVIAIHRVGETHGLPFLVMPYINGETLQQRINQSGPLTLEATLRIAAQIASGLSAAHANGLIHRDIKPANILLGPGTDRVTITDFGLARVAGETGMTRTGVIAGTPHYMSPEQANGELLDTPSDLFSLGSVMYTMLTGKPPFQGIDVSDVITQVRKSKPRPLRDVQPLSPQWLDLLLAWFLEKSPGDRPQSTLQAKELIHQCQLHWQDESNSLPSELVQGPLTSRKKVFAGIVLSLVVGVAFFFARPQTHENIREPSLPHESAPVVSSIDEIHRDMDAIEKELVAIELTLPPSIGKISKP